MKKQITIKACNRDGKIIDFRFLEDLARKRESQEERPLQEIIDDDEITDYTINEINEYNSKKADYQ